MIKRSFQHIKIFFNLNSMIDVEPLNCFVCFFKTFNIWIQNDNYYIPFALGVGDMSHIDMLWELSELIRRSHCQTLQLQSSSGMQQNTTWEGISPHFMPPPTIHKVNSCKRIPKRSPLCLEKWYMDVSVFQVLTVWQQIKKQLVDGPAEGHIYCSAVL